VNNILKENENNDSNQNEYNAGRWTNEEHEKFIEGILKFGNEWKRVQSIIKTRSSTQARSHAQKFFLRLKKEISPKIISDQNLLIQYIINTSNNIKKYSELTQEQKEKLFSVIRSNLKPDEIQNKSSKDNQSINEDNKQFEQKMEYNNEEYDDLAYYKYNNINLNKSEKDNKRKITFCSKKRKSSSDLLLTINSNKIFNISKDINHKKSMEIKKTNNYMNNLSLQNSEEDQKQYNLNNHKKISNINNNYIINNNN
jgi:SHAQKYF class myb-like DNA-binding protein